MFLALAHGELGRGGWNRTRRAGVSISVLLKKNVFFYLGGGRKYEAF